MKTPKKSIISEALASIPRENTIFITRLGQIADRVEAILDAKGWSQKDLAHAMGKKESEISKWLNTPHNLTLKSIAKIEAALDEDIIHVAGSTLTYIKAHQREWAPEQDFPMVSDNPEGFETANIIYIRRNYGEAMYG